MAVVELHHRVMASATQMLVVDGDPDAGRRAVACLEHLERRWSRFLPDSDISRLNATPDRPVGVSRDTITLLHAMLEGWHLTAGRYDPTVLPALRRAGYTDSINAPGANPPAIVAAPLDAHHRGRLAELFIDAVNDVAMLPSGVQLDPGGIGKGLAADLAVAQILTDGATGALVSIGGDSPWPAGRRAVTAGWCSWKIPPSR